MLRLCLAPVFALYACAATASVDGDLPAAPADGAILTVGGAIGCTNDGDEAVFDLEGLEQVGHSEIQTSTIWTEGEQVFEGVRLDTLLEAVCAEGNGLRATALNEYQVDIPLDAMIREGALIAYRLNGAEMTLRDRGPVWIVFPWDQEPAYQTEDYYNRSVWQLERLDVIE